MPTPPHNAFQKLLVAAGLSAMILPAAWAQSLARNPVAVAVRNGDCKGAARLLSPVATENDRDSAFLGGRLLREGICLEQNPVGAAHFFAHAADLGNRQSMVDFATSLGQGEGSDQSYAHAGEVCRGAGFDPQKKLSPYSLGYACTVLGVASRIMRTTLPEGAFLPDSGDAVVRFNAATGSLEVLETPHVARAPKELGSLIGKPLFDAHEEIAKAWNTAMTKVPTPDTARLDHADVDLTLDLDMTLERGLNLASDRVAPFQPAISGAIMRTFRTTP